MTIVYLVMAIWLLVGSAIRIALELDAGAAPDALPLISGSIGLIALLLLLPAFDEWRNRS